MNIKPASLLFAMLSLAACGAGDQPATRMLASITSNSAAVDTTSAIDSGQFLIATYQANLGDIALSRLALQLSNDDRVRQFAQRMIDDHTRLNGEIIQLATLKSVPLPTVLTADQQGDAQRIGAVVANVFDLRYMALSAEHHDKLTAAATLQAQQGGDVDVRQLASLALPALELHHGRAVEVITALNPPSLYATLYRDGLFEVRFAQLALQKSGNDAVRQFAQRMIDDHGALNGAIQLLAPAKSVSLPNDVGMAQQVALDTYGAFAGADFDRAFMDKNIIGHALAVRLMQDLAAHSTDADLMQFAQQTLPGLSGHLGDAQQLASQIVPSYLFAAAQDSTSQLRLAHAGQADATAPVVHDFIDQLSIDVSGGMQATRALATARQISLPVAVTPEEMSVFTNLSMVTGNVFDLQLVGALTQVLTRAQQREAIQSDDMADPGLNSLAVASLPITTSHLNTATQLLQQLTPAD